MLGLQKFFNSEFPEAILPLTSFLCGPVDEEVHGSNLSDLLFLSVQPKDLLAILLGCLTLNSNCRPVVTKKHKTTITVAFRPQNIITLNLNILKEEVSNEHGKHHNS